MDFQITLPRNETDTDTRGRTVETTVTAAWGGARYVQSEGTVLVQLILFIGESWDFPSFYRAILSHDQNNSCAHFRNP